MVNLARKPHNVVQRQRNAFGFVLKYGNLIALVASCGSELDIVKRKLVDVPIHMYQRRLWKCAYNDTITVKVVIYIRHKGKGISLFYSILAWGLALRVERKPD